MPSPRRPRAAARLLEHHRRPPVQAKPCSAALLRARVCVAADSPKMSEAIRERRSAALQETERNRSPAGFGGGFKALYERNLEFAPDTIDPTGADVFSFSGTYQPQSPRVS